MTTSGSIGDFARLIRANDGVAAFNEASLLALSSDQPARVRLVVEDGPRIVAAAFADGTAPIDLAVHPDRRRRGHGTALMDRLLDAGERRFWAHGDLPAARGWAAQLGFDRERTLLRLTLRDRGTVGDPPPPDGVAVRPFRDSDTAGLLAVNARAFSEHPEQGAMDRANFDLRRSAGWYDPTGLFVAERDGEIVGFHWTKVDQRVGEVYVLAVDPDRAGTGVGTALLAHGLEHLSGADIVELYVEADNARALDLYTAAGFTEASRDVLYVSRMPAAAGPAPS